MDSLQALGEIKNLNPACKVLVVADAATWQLARNVPEVDLVSLKGFSIQHFRSIIDPLLTKKLLNGVTLKRKSPNEDV